MPINFQVPQSVELKPRIVVIGVGGAGGNAVNNMIEAGLDGVEFVVANTDAQALALSKAERRVQMGSGITQGLGAGMRPEVGEQSAEENLDEIMAHLDGAHMLFVAAGMGGGTGTGAAPVIARAARERGILTVAIVTKPFSFEGTRRMRLAEEGIERVYSSVDTLIVIPNQNLFRIATEQTTMTAAFAMADEVLNSGVRSVTDLMMVPGMINLDFNDVRTVMDEMGKAMMGTGEATGDRRAVEAAEAAISNPLLDDVSLTGAKGVLINITGGNDLTLFEVDEAAELIRQQVDEDANIIVGSAQDPDLEGIVRVSVVATGVDSDVQPARAPLERVTPIRPLAQMATPRPAPPSRETHGVREVQGVREMQANVETAFETQAAQDRDAPAHGTGTRETSAQPAPVAAPVSASTAAPAPDTSSAPAQRPYASPLSASRTVEPDAARVPVRPAPVEPAPAQPAPAQSTSAQSTSAPSTPMGAVPAAAPAPRPRFGFFGRRARSVPIVPPAPRASENKLGAKLPAGDLFDDAHAEELEIPSFLRRNSAR